MALTVLQNPTNPNPSGVFYSGRCATCGVVVYGQIAAGQWTFYQANPGAQYVPTATAQPILFAESDAGHIVDWLWADCPTGGCPATIWTTTKAFTKGAPAANPVSNSPLTSQPLT